MRYSALASVVLNLPIVWATSGCENTSPPEVAELLPAVAHPNIKTESGICAQFIDNEKISVPNRLIPQAHKCLTQLCLSGNPGACRHVAGLLQYGLLGEKDIPLAIQLLEHGCTLENSICFDFLYLMDESDSHIYMNPGLERKLASLAEVYTHECRDLSSGVSCGRLGYMLIKAWGLPEDSELGISYIKAGCQFGYVQRIEYCSY